MITIPSTDQIRANDQLLLPTPPLLTSTHARAKFYVSERYEFVIIYAIDSNLPYRSFRCRMTFVNSDSQLYTKARDNYLIGIIDHLRISSQVLFYTTQAISLMEIYDYTRYVSARLLFDRDTPIILGWYLEKQYTPTLWIRGTRIANCLPAL